ncbi:MAG: HaeII family restriction endonuclease [bacterium]
MKSKDALDKIIKKSRVHLYKPIQIAEVLYNYRNGANIDPADVETYRNISKKWRDEISKLLVGRISTSSQKFQDNVFDSNAMPPEFVKELAEYNKEHGGIVENYIYHKFKERLSLVCDAFDYLKAGPNGFNLNEFLSLFVNSPGLKRSIDKVYEITVYALFSVIVRALKVEVALSIENADEEILNDFSVFIKMALGLSEKTLLKKIPAKLFRVGVTNAADRGLDMWANFGPAVQVKHLTLSEDLAEDVSDNLTADKIVLVCLDAEAETIHRIMTQLSFSDRIQGIITISDLESWYKTCLSDKYKSKLGSQLLTDLEREFDLEFPANSQIDPFIRERGYEISALKGEWSISAND